MKNHYTLLPHLATKLAEMAGNPGLASAFHEEISLGMMDALHERKTAVRLCGEAEGLLKMLLEGTDPAALLRSIPLSTARALHSELVTVRMAALEAGDQACFGDLEAGFIFMMRARCGFHEEDLFMKKGPAMAVQVERQGSAYAQMEFLRDVGATEVVTLVDRTRPFPIEEPELAAKEAVG